MSQITRYIAGGGAGGPIEFLTGNVGGAVGPDAHSNINVEGDGLTIEVTGNPGTNTLTIATTGVTIVNYTLVNVTPYDVLDTDQFLGVDTTAMPITIRLPNVTVAGRVIMIKDILGNSAVNNIDVTTPGGITLIDQVANYDMNTNFSSVQVIFDGADYSVF